MTLPTSVRSRRAFLRMAGVAAAGSLLAACTPAPAAQPTAKPAAAATTAPAAKPTSAPAKPAATTAPAAKPAAKADPAREAQLVQGAQSEGEVVVWVYNMHEPEKVLAGFKAKYPFLTVTIFESRGGEILAKLGEEQRAGRFTPDVLILSSEMTTAQEQGYLQEYEFPNAQGWPHQPSTNFYRITDGSPWVIAYNTNTVAEADVPKSYDALLDPKLSKYKFILSTSGEDTPLYWAAMYGGGNTLNWEQSEQFWTRLFETHKPDSKPGFTGPLQEVSAGEYDFLPGSSQSSTLRLRDQGAPLGIAPMPTAPTNANSALALARNAPHPNAAKLYIDYYTTPEGVSAFADAQWYIPFQGGAYEQGVRAVEAAKGLGIDFVLTDPALITTDNLQRSSQFWFKTLGVTPG